MLILQDERRLFQATGRSKCEINIDDNLSLRLQGIRVSTLRTASKPSDTLRGQWIGPNIFKYGDWWNLAQTCGDDVDSTTGEELEIAFGRARIWDTLPRHSPSGYIEKRVLCESPALGDVRQEIRYPEELELAADDFQVRHIDTDLVVPIIRGTFEQRLFIDDECRIVIAHEACIEGDEVWLVMGSALPYILRPLATRGYEFKGEAYVHGIMDGEYLVDKFKRSDIKSDVLSDKQ